MEALHLPVLTGPYWYQVFQTFFHFKWLNIDAKTHKEILEPQTCKHLKSTHGFSEVHVKCNVHKPLKRHLFDLPDVPLRSMLRSNAYTSSQSSWLQCLRDDYIYDENLHKLGIDEHSHSNPHKLQKCVETSWCHLTNTSCKSWLLRSSLQLFCHDGKQQYANTCLKLWWSNLTQSQEAEL